jgi:hypothetical protein
MKKILAVALFVFLPYKAVLALSVNTPVQEITQAPGVVKNAITVANTTPSRRVIRLTTQPYPFPFPSGKEIEVKVREDLFEIKPDTKKKIGYIIKIPEGTNQGSHCKYLVFEDMTGMFQKKSGASVTVRVPICIAVGDIEYRYAISRKGDVIEIKNLSKYRYMCAIIPAESQMSIYFTINPLETMRFQYKKGEVKCGHVKHSF